MMRLLPFLLLLLSSGCGSMTTPGQFARELVIRSAPVLSFRSTGDEITIDQRTIDAVRTAVEAENELMAIVQLPQGVHPFMVVVFVKKDQEVDLLMTSVYWGRIQGKWLSTVDFATAESLVQAATKQFRCEKGSVEDFIFGTTVIYWVDGEQMTCDGGWGTEEGATFGRRFQRIFDRARSTYEPT